MPIPESLLEAADELNIKLEIVNGLGTWEGQPLLRHQSAAVRIHNSVRPAARTNGACGCYSALDVVIRFPDGSEKRPDISIFCREPELDEAITQVPGAVIEVLSKGYERKDTEIGAPFFLEQGVMDVVLFDPRSLEVTHLRRDGVRNLTSPVRIAFECGCECEV